MSLKKRCECSVKARGSAAFGAFFERQFLLRLCGRDRAVADLVRPHAMSGSARLFPHRDWRLGWGIYVPEGGLADRALPARSGRSIARQARRSSRYRHPKRSCDCSRSTVPATVRWGRTVGLCPPDQAQLSLLTPASVRTRSSSLANSLGETRIDDVAVIEDIGTVGDCDAAAHVLFDEQNGNPLLARRDHDPEDFFHDQRRQALATAHRAAAAFGLRRSARAIASISCSPPDKLPTLIGLALGEPREKLVDAGNVPGPRPVDRHFQIFFDRQARKNTPAFGNIADAEPRDAIRRPSGRDVSKDAHCALPRWRQSDQAAHGRRLAGTIASEKRDDLAFAALRGSRLGECGSCRNRCGGLPPRALLLMPLQFRDRRPARPRWR